jgi:hypothetical protein
MRGLKTQYLDLANRHSFPDLDPLSEATVPRIDEVETSKARRYRLYAACALFLGLMLAAVLSALSINFPSWTLLFAGTVLIATIFSFMVVGVIWATIKAGPENPGCMKAVWIWTILSGIAVLGSAAVFGWMRFVDDLKVLSQLGIVLVIFEAGAFVLGGSFECGYVVYKWSFDLYQKYDGARVERDTVSQGLIQVSVEVDDLQFRLGKRTSEEDVPERVKDNKDTDKIAFVFGGGDDAA